MQPLDATGTLAALPKNIATSNAYFAGFPTDQPTYTITSGASFTNMFSLSNNSNQILTFPTTSAALNIACPNTYPLTACNVSVSVMLGNATSFVLSVSFSGTTYATNTYTSANGLSTNNYTNITLPFTSPGFAVGGFNVSIGNRVGTLNTRGWAVFAGSAVDTQIRGNLKIPYGSVSSSDFIYGASGTSLAATIPTLATAASVSAITPTYLGLGNVANTSPSGLPISSAVQTALNGKLNTHNIVYTGFMNNNGLTFTVDTGGNIGCNSIQSVDYITCPDLRYNGGTTFLKTSLSNINSTLTSQLTTISTLAPISSFSTMMYANTFNAATSMTCASFRVNGDATVIGDVLYGLGGTSLSTLTTAVNGKAPLANPSFTGTALSTLGDIKYNGATTLTSLTAQMTTLNGYKTSGAISGTSTYQTMYTVALGTRGFITVIAASPTYNMFMGLFEWTSAATYQSLTQLAQSGNTNQSNLNTTNASSAGTVSLSVQQVANTGLIQAKVITASPITWYVNLI
jgi:hypothetical protein